MCAGSMAGMGSAVAARCPERQPASLQPCSSKLHARVSPAQSDHLVCEVSQKRLKRETHRACIDAEGAAGDVAALGTFAVYEEQRPGEAAHQHAFPHGQQAVAGAGVRGSWWSHIQAHVHAGTAAASSQLAVAQGRTPGRWTSGHLLLLCVSGRPIPMSGLAAEAQRGHSEASPPRTCTDQRRRGRPCPQAALPSPGPPHSAALTRPPAAAAARTALGLAPVCMERTGSVRSELTLVQAGSSS